MSWVDLADTTIEYKLRMRDALRQQIQEIESRPESVGNSPEAYVDLLKLKDLFDELSSKLVDEMQKLHYPEVYKTPEHGVLA